MNKNLRKNKIILPIVIILTLVVLIGGTYAIFARVDEANIANNYKTGNLHIVIDDTSEGLGGNLNLPSIPLSDEEGSTLEPYKFKVINKGNLWYEYDLKLLKDMITTEADSCVNNQIPSNYIKVKLDDEEPILLSELEESKIIKEEILPAYREIYYELRIWIDEGAPNSVIGSHFHSKVSVDGYAIQPIESIVTNIEYTGNYQEYVAQYNGLYKIELWGAGGPAVSCENTNAIKSNGAYTSGNIYLKKNEKLIFYVGGKGKNQCSSGTGGGGYNGGGNGTYGGSYASSGKKYIQSNGGGGATDVRFFGKNIPDDLNWDNIDGLTARIMVAGGGTVSMAGGGISSLASTPGSQNNSSYSTYYVTGATQTSGGYSTYNTSLIGTFGKGSNGENLAQNYGSKGGGGGYYGGGGSISNNWSQSGSRYQSGDPTGGSSFISGHTGCVAITSSESTTARTGTDGASCTTGTADNLCSIHYSGKYFTDTLMIDGAGYTWTNVKASTVGTNLMPNPLGDYYASGVGHSGNGYARITFVG